jgi:hypothetical protein
METQPARIPLAVLDPALGSSGAHNRGFAESLAARGEAASGLWCARSIAGDLAAPLRAAGVVVEPVFTFDFYALFHRDGGIAEHWDWIYRAAREYRRALDGVLARWPRGQVQVLHHTLSWEHAAALALALDMPGADDGRLRHLALLMYSPGVAPDGRVLDPSRRANFLAGFASLAGRSDVSLHAGCSEHAAAYAHLLRRGHPLPVHPCFLGDWRRPRPDGAGRERGRVLAYLGEPKQEKGFLELPDRLARMAHAQPDPAARFVVHCASSRTQAARDVLAAIEALAYDDPRIEVHGGFWSDARLHGELARADVLCLDYDARAYAHKTSGLLWLAAWHGLPTRVPDGSWLEREARRLGLPVLGPHAAADARGARRGRCDKAYFDTIFQPFDAWLDARLPRVDPPPATQPQADPTALAGVREALAGSSTRPVAAAEGNGVDVVLFWKQNDSTLYGRRNDMVARYLASRDDVRRVLVIDSPISDARLATLAAGDAIDQQRWIHQRTLEKLRGEHDAPRVRHAVYVYPASSLGDGAHEHGTPEFTGAYGDFLARRFAAEGIEPGRALFWIFPREFSLPRLLDRFRPGRVVVDVVDDHRAWPGVSDADRARFDDNYRALLARADLALANCASVQAAMRAFHPDVRLVPNGCDAFDDSDHPPPPWPGVGGRTLGFVGNLEAKIDLALLHRLAREFPADRLVLVGSTHANPRVRELQQHPNVVLAGVVPYARLGDWIAHFDVGLVPHLDMAMTRAMHPLKTGVYLSRGVPVVSTAVANVEADGELVRMAVSHDAFVHQVRQVLAAGRPPAARFQAHVAANDWRSRLHPHVDALDLRDLLAR